MRTETLAAIEFAERTDPGRDPNKQVNEDACGHRHTPYGHLAVVCDGMGGHEGGRDASQLALRTIFESFERAAPGQSPAMLLRAAVEEANRRVFALPASPDEGRPGATVVALLHHTHGTEIAHVGDSRAFLIHGGNVVQLTRDHSMVQQMVDANLITAEQAVGHPDANKISRALGMKADVDVEVRPQPVLHVTGDTFVLASDGLTDLVTAEEILRIAGGAPPPQAAGQLVDLANARGGHDNITVQILRVNASAAPGASGLAPTVVDTQPPAAGEVPSALPPIPTSRPVAITHTDDHGPASRAGAARSGLPSPIVLVGVALGLVGLALAGVAIYLVTAGSSHHAPVLVEGEGGPAAEARADAEALEVAPLPPSEPSSVESAPLPELDPPPGGRRRMNRDR